MAMWRCPHCGTPQAETARCWVCRRSSTSCGTCRHFRVSVAAKMGYCGLDRQRRPLSGDEIRACWESSPEPVETSTIPSPPPTFTRTPVPRRDFIEVVQAVRTPAGRRASRPDQSPIVDPSPATVAPVAPRWSLWEDAEG